jgi:hypothetical protein
VLVILASTSTKALLNASLEHQICHARGLRQGDPLSLLLSVLVMEVLGALIRKADEWGLFQPLGLRSIPFRASFYADDLVLFISPRVQGLQQLRQIFDILEDASGLGCNVNKCQMAAIRCDDSQKQLASSTFPFQQVNFPIKYFGMPLSTSKLPRSALQPLLDKATDKLPVWKGSMMHRSGRLTLVKSMLSIVPIYTAICMGLPAWMHKALFKIAKAFLWSGLDVVHASNCLVAWERVQRPLHFGGLGVLDMKRMGMALWLRWLWYWRTDSSRPWVGLPYKEDRVTTTFFKASIQCLVGNGSSTLFWLDPWLQGRSVKQIAPDLFAALDGRYWHRHSVVEALESNSWLRDIRGL